MGDLIQESTALFTEENAQNHLFPKDDNMVDGTNIPSDHAVLDLAPKEICRRTNQLRENGYKVMVAKPGSRKKEKTLHMDYGLSRIFYTPSVKPQTQIDIPVATITVLKEIENSDPPEFHIESKEGRAYNIACHSRADRDDIMSAIVFARNKQQASVEDPLRARLIQYWIAADQNGDGKLSLEELEQISKRLHILLPGNQISRMMRQADKDKSGYLDFGEFRSFIEDLTKFEQLRILFDTFAVEEPKTFMKVKEFLNFMKDVQGEVLAPKTASRVIKENTAEPSPGFTMYYFSMFLLNPDYNGWQHPRSERVEGLKAPLSSFHIKTSHNTFLTGAQTGSKSCATGYERALSQGFRCLELQVYDGVGDEPVVHNGPGTETTKTCLLAIMASIKKYAFATTDTPLILVFDVHCSDTQQLVVAQYIRTAFTNALVPYQNALKCTVQQLLKKVIVVGNVKIGDGLLAFDPKVRPSKESPPEFPINGTLSDCFSLPFIKAGGDTLGLVRVMESTSAKAPESDRNFVLVYPDVSRKDSSNLSVSSWLQAGYHMVGVNAQTEDASWILYKAFFQQNGKSGYVPLLGHKSGHKYKVNVAVLLGYHLPTEGTDDHTRISVTVRFLSSEGTVVKETAQIPDNAYNPCFNEYFEFVTASIEACAIQIETVDHDSYGNSAVLGSNIIALPSLRIGYRACPMLDPRTDARIPLCALLCHFAIALVE
jgi:phosphatidylinositol phospholipase C delta